MPAEPSPDAMIRLLIVRQVQSGAIVAAVQVDLLDALMTRARDLEVDRLDLVRDIDAIKPPADYDSDEE